MPLLLGPLCHLAQDYAQREQSVWVHRKNVSLLVGPQCHLAQDCGLETALFVSTASPHEWLVRALHDPQQKRWMRMPAL